ncbi:hypothetical protein CPB84DRAFT_1769554 [Gymnopilus junonius]|uniref:Uncharacterized protein n=1 Tax=Gymnopilus junonius TaxID=109634 RepID=A0A9P5TQH7_GYMJU|nr:hypothetical protein CPB84DRAFT_1769554 [Gymnopilus junonius]
MSFSVDDLVSSLSSNHIGQEQMDLDTLHAQLAETLVAGPSSSNHYHRVPATRSGRMQHTQRCNTPLARTPSSSTFSHASTWGMNTSPQNHNHNAHIGSRSRSNSVSTLYIDETEEDERMVEELLIPMSPASSSIPTSPSNSTPHLFSYSNTYSDPRPSSPATSLFTTTDPFYIAQLQALSQQSQPQTQTVFAQNGRLSQSSPFAVPMQMQHHSQSQWDNVGAMPMGMVGHGHASMARAAAF